MGLYLCVFANERSDEEVDGIDVGGYDDFEIIRGALATALEGGRRGRRFPLFMLHHDSDGTWAPNQLPALQEEIETMAREASRAKAVHIASGWQQDVANQAGLKPTNLHESLFDVDGAPFLDRLLNLVHEARLRTQPIWFQ